MHESPAPPPSATPEPREQCRAITTSGGRCKKNAMYNSHLCYPHAHHRNPVLPHPSHVAIPLLEDHASLQLVLSQIAHGLLSEKLDPERGRTLIYLCQVVAATLPRPARLPNPPREPANRRPEHGAPSLEAGDRGLGTDHPEPSAPRPAEGQSIYRLALDDQGLICGDGAFPAPSAYWQPPAPHVTPFELIDAAPNRSKPTPRSPFEAETHHNCAICNEIRRMQSNPTMHPHLQPEVNPFCKFNMPGCQGPASDNRCRACDAVYRYNPDKYDRPRRSRPRHHRSQHTNPGAPHRAGFATWGTGETDSQSVPDAPSPSVAGPVGSHNSGPASGDRGRSTGDCRPATGDRGPATGDWGPATGDCSLASEPEPQPLPNPLPDPFPDDLPPLPAEIDWDTDLEAAADPDPTLDLRATADPAPAINRPPAPDPLLPIACCLLPAFTPAFQVIPKPYYPLTLPESTKPHPSQPGGYPHRQSGTTTQGDQRTQKNSEPEKESRIAERSAHAAITMEQEVSRPNGSPYARVVLPGFPCRLPARGSSPGPESSVEQ